MKDVSERLSKRLLDKAPFIMLPKEHSVEVVKTMLEIVQEMVSEGDRVTLLNFGSFEPVDKKARMTRNPQTGKQIEAEARVVPKFRPAKAFKDRVNEALKQRLNSE